MSTGAQKRLDDVALRCGMKEGRAVPLRGLCFFQEAELYRRTLLNPLSRHRTFSSPSTAYGIWLRNGLEGRQHPTSPHGIPN